MMITEEAKCLRANNERILIRLYGCADLLESSLGARDIRYVLSYCGSFAMRLIHNIYRN